jgi:uncharacterized tellurite resistance protein B-like protein
MRLTSLRALLGVAPDAGSTDSDAVEPIAAELGRLEPEVARYLAAYAFMLSRLAAADHEVTHQEARTIERLLQEKGSLPPAQAALVVELARTQQDVFGATDDFLVTRELRRVASYDQRVHMIDALFAVATADGRIHVQEGSEIGRIARELRVEEADLARIRHAYRDFLSARRTEP